jgi:acyl-ACP thioesterase
VTEPSREFFPRQAGVREFSGTALATISDCAPSGRARLDALARWQQDVAYADIRDVGLESVAVWVVRRTRIRVNRWPRFGEELRLTTFITGLGRMWAERRTDLWRVDREGGNAGADTAATGADTADAGADTADAGADAGNAGVDARNAGATDADQPRGRPDVEGMSLWVHLDPERRMPFPLTEAEITTYSGPEPQRRITARLRHPAPPPAEQRQSSPWRFRATECDLAEHVNNAAYWLPLEEELLQRRPSTEDPPLPLDVELEYRAPAQPGAMRWVADGPARWIVGNDEAGADEVHASFLLAPRLRS